MGRSSGYKKTKNIANTRGAIFGQGTISNSHEKITEEHQAVGDELSGILLYLREKSEKTGKIWGSSGMKVSGINLEEVALTGINFENSTWSDSTLTNVCFQHENKELNSLMTGAVLESIKGEEIDWGGCNLGGVSFKNTVIDSGSFIQANLRGAILSSSNKDYNSFKNANFRDADLRQATFFGSDFSGTIFSVAQFSSNISFDGANLKEAIFSGSDLDGASFINANLSGARLTNAKMSGLNFSNSDLSNSFFYGIEKGKDPFCFSSASVRDVSFENSCLDRADFKGADLENTVFYNVSLKGADFTDCASLGGVVFKNCDLDGASFPDGTSAIDFDNCTGWLS